ncbi:RlpA-like double-psi beta-barrel-protein domain-containing protein-containing protein [Aspergillus venezuelensis]
MRFTNIAFLAVLTTVFNATFVGAGLATTTHYSDGLQGACGCGTDLGTFTWQYGISHGLYTAAASQALFDSAGPQNHWCGSGCGKCYQLTSTGVSTCPECGAGGEEGKSITVMVTNLCPSVGNEAWCPDPGELNPAGYGVHFDIMGGKGVFGDNVVVEFAEVPCPHLAGGKWGTCECHPDFGKGVASAGDGVQPVPGGGEVGPGAGAAPVPAPAADVVGPEMAAVISVGGSPPLPVQTAV